MAPTLVNNVTLARSRLFDLRYHGLNLAAITGGDYASFSLSPSSSMSISSSHPSSPQLRATATSSDQKDKKHHDEDDDEEEETEDDLDDDEHPLARLMGSRAFTFGASPNRQQQRQQQQSSNSGSTRRHQQHRDPTSQTGMGQPSASSPVFSSSSTSQHHSHNHHQKPHDFIKQLGKNLHVSQHLKGHGGCVNSIELNSDASILLTGSDDTFVGLYSTIDSNKWTSLGMIPTAHTRNIFNAVFVPQTNDQHIVSCGLDGNTVLTIVGDGGAPRSTTAIYESDYMCSSLEVSPSDPNILYVTRGSGGVSVLDLRTKRQIGEFSVTGSIQSRPCNGVASHPHYPFVLAVGTSDSPVIYMCDTRMLPGYTRNSAGQHTHFTDGNSSFLAISNRQAAMNSDGVGGLNFSDRGDKIVVSYKGGEVVAYDWLMALPASNRRRLSHETAAGIMLSSDFNSCKYSHHTEVPAKVYAGRRNDVTMFKEAAFFADDRIVASGGDCGNVFFWDAQTCKLIAKVRGDSDVVNGVLTHPALDAVVCCGIDSSPRVITASEKHNHSNNSNDNDNNNHITWKSSRTRYYNAHGDEVPAPLNVNDNNNDRRRRNSNGNAADEENTNNDDDDDDQPVQERSPRSLFRLRAALMRALFAGRGLNDDGSDDDDDEDGNDNDGGDLGDEDEGGGDVDFDIWAGEEGGDNDHSMMMRRRRRGLLGHHDDDDDDDDEEHVAQANEELRGIILSTIVTLRRPTLSRGTLGQLTEFFLQRARSIRQLVADTARVIDDEDEEDDDEELADETEDDHDDENGEEEEKDDDEKQVELSDVGQDNDDDEKSANRDSATEKKSSGKERSAAVGSSSSDAAAAIPKIVLESDPILDAFDTSDDENEENEEDEEEDKDEEEESGNDSDDSDDENSDDGLLQHLIDACHSTIELAKSVIGRCHRAGILSDDPVAPTVLAPRRRTPAGEPEPRLTPEVHPLIELASAIIDVAYLSLLDKDHLASLSLQMRQVYQEEFIRVLVMRASLRAAVGDYDGAMSHAMEILDMDDTRVEAIGVAVGVAKIRLRMGQPEPEGFLNDLIQTSRSIQRSRMVSLSTRRQGLRLERNLQALIDGGREHELRGGSVPTTVTTTTTTLTSPSMNRTEDEEEEVEEESDETTATSSS